LEVLIKLLKSMSIDSAGGRVGGSPLSFLHPLKHPDIRMRARVRDNIFFMVIFLIKKLNVKLYFLLYEYDTKILNQYTLPGIF